MPTCPVKSKKYTSTEPKECERTCQCPVKPKTETNESRKEEEKACRCALTTSKNPKVVATSKPACSKVVKGSSAVSKQKQNERTRAPQIRPNINININGDQHQPPSLI